MAQIRKVNELPVLQPVLEDVRIPPLWKEPPFGIFSGQRSGECTRPNVMGYWELFERGVCKTATVYCHF